MREIVIAGGGPAGAAAACLLAGAGRAVTLIERDAAPAHKICGEFLSAEAQQDLAALGLDLAALGARPISRVRLVRGAAVVQAALPFRGLGLSRRTLDEALLRHAAACGAEVMRGHAIRSLRTEDAPGRGLTLDVAGIGELRAATVFLATGKHDLRGVRRQVRRPPPARIGFKTYFTLAPAQARALEGQIEIILFAGGYAGLQMVEGGLANLCLLAGSARFERAGRQWQGLLDDLRRGSSHLHARLAGAVPQLARPLSIWRVPYGFVHVPRPTDPPGLFRLGDQAGVIPSFSGDGISIALHSARVAARTWLGGGDAGVYHRRLRREIGGQIARAMVLDRCGATAGGQAMLMGACRAWPPLLRAVAELTRIPAAARCAGNAM